MKSILARLPSMLLAALACACMLAALSALLVPPPPPVAKAVTVVWQADGTESVERCTACHAEPKHSIELASIHPTKSLGCTVCHRGDGSRSDKSAHASMLPAQSGCGHCHRSDVDFRSRLGDGRDWAPDLTRGRSLARSLRCGGCHMVATTPGPSLDAIAERASKAEVVLFLTSPSLAHPTVTEDEAFAIAASIDDKRHAERLARASHPSAVPGATAAEGKVIAGALGCAECHDAPALARMGTRDPDFLAYFLANPMEAGASLGMPSFRLTQREAAAIAQWLGTLADPQRTAKLAAFAKNATHDAARGEARMTSGGCGGCHEGLPGRIAVDLGGYRDTHDERDARRALDTHTLPLGQDDEGKRVLSLWLLSLSKHKPRLEIDPEERRDVAALLGRSLVFDLGCRACHVIEGKGGTRAPTLHREGARVQPAWLFAMLKDPQRNGVRPMLHPEWVYRDLVPLDRTTMRMPSYALSDEDANAIVSYFARWDGAAYPFATGDSEARPYAERLASVAHVVRKESGACLDCHFIGTLPEVRLKAGGVVAPDFALTRSRLRPTWVKAFLMQPEPWAKDHIKCSDSLAVGIADLLSHIGKNTKLPPAHQEDTLPILGLE